MSFIKTENQRTVLSLLTSLISMGLNILISFFLAPYIVTNFGEEANGFTQLANNFVNYATLLTVALNSMAARFITISYHKGEYDKCSKYYSSVMIGNIFIVMLLIVPSLFFILNLENIINIETSNVIHVKFLFAFVFANFYVSLINGVLSISFYVKNSLYIQNVYTALRYFVNIIGLIIMFTLFSPSIYFVSLMGLICSFLILFCYLYEKRKIMPNIRFSIYNFDYKAIFTMISSGIWNTLNQCGNLLMTGFDLLLSNLLVGPIQMGILSVAKTIPNCIVQLGTMINSSFSPNLTISYASGKKEDIISSLRFSMKCSSFFMSIPLMVLAVYGVQFYRLWVPSMNSELLSVLSILSCLAFIPFSGPQTLYNVYTTTNKLKINSITVILGGILNIIIVYILLQYTNLGLYAIAGVSSIVSLLRNLVVTVPYTAYLLNLKWYTFYKDVGISLLCCFCSACVCLIINYILPTDSWGNLIVAVTISCVISAISLFLILLNRPEKKKILEKFKGVKVHG